jgi:hypothetical protein
MGILPKDFQQLVAFLIHSEETMAHQMTRKEWLET